MVLGYTTIPIRDGDSLPDSVMAGSPSLFIRIRPTGGLAAIAMVIATAIITVITVVITTDTGPVMPGDVTIPEMYTEAVLRSSL